MHFDLRILLRIGIDTPKGRLYFENEVVPNTNEST